MKIKFSTFFIVAVLAPYSVLILSPCQATAQTRSRGRPIQQGAKPNSGEIAPPLPLRGFEFETVMVDSKGTVKNRQKGRAQYFTEDINQVSLEMVMIPGGKFLMGSPDVEEGRGDDEGPQHTVRVSTFYLGKYEITQAQWRAAASLPKVKRDLNPDPSQFKGDNLPVESVLWEDAVEFCERLMKATGRQAPRRGALAGRTDAEAGLISDRTNASDVNIFSMIQAARRQRGETGE